MKPSESHQSAKASTGQAGRDVDVGRVADQAFAIWQEVDTALAPVIGARGVGALYRRSLFLTATDHPWLAGLLEKDPAVVDAAALRAVLVQQEAETAAAGAGALFETFDELLASLVGTSLTGRLLAAARALSTSGTAARGTSP